LVGDAADEEGLLEVDVGELLLVDEIEALLVVSFSEDMTCANQSPSAPY
jgi:hypothetical protein